ncbi:MAG: ATP-binding protein [Rhizobacter sp.]
MGARAFDLLLALIERRDRVVLKSELLDLVWPRMVVEENNLPVQVGNLRRLLGPHAIATIPGRGYRFVAPLVEPAAGAPKLEMPAAPDPGTNEGSQPSTPPRPNPPLPTPALFGRANELARLAALLEAHPLVTIVGAGGIGKSRLAQAVSAAQAGRFRDGVCGVELAGLADSSLIAHAVAQPLGLSVPEGEGSTQTLVNALADRQMLLVLDNCEHLLEPLAVFVERLLEGAPTARVLATSQEPLRLRAEQQLRLEPLAVPRDASVAGARDYGALVLFESRVRAAAPHFEIRDADLPLVIDVCRQLDGLPLAIELAAARVSVLGLRSVHSRLSERFLLLTAGTRTALRRHQTLRAAMDWSHGLLDEPQRTVFRRLGVFSGGFTMELAQALCADDGLDAWAVLEQLAALIDKSLVVVDVVEPVRYRLLESARAFALEQLAAAGETAAFVKRHAETMLAFLRRADDGNLDSTLRSDQYAALVLPEFDNLRAAYGWAAGEGGDRAFAIGLAAHAGPLIDYSTEFAQWLIAQRPHLAPGVVDAMTVARFWRALAPSNMLRPLSLPELLEAAQRAAAAYRELGRPRRLFSALRLTAVWRRASGDREGARAAIEQAAALIEADWPAEFRLVALRFRVLLSRDAGQFELARSQQAESLRLAREARDWRLEVIERSNAADLRWEMGELDEAARDLAELLAEMQRRPASDFEVIEAVSMRVAILGESGRTEKAAAAARDALPVIRRMPKFRFEAYAQLLWRLGRYEAAAQVLGALAARARQGQEQPQFNEERIARATLAGLQAALPPPRLAAALAIGESLTETDLCTLVADALGVQHEGGRALPG